MKRIMPLILTGFLLTISSLSYSAEPQFQLTIKSAAEVFLVGDEINIKAVLTNTGAEPLKIYTPDFGGVSHLKVTDAQGKELEPQEIRAIRVYTQDLTTVAPGASKEYVYFNLTYFKRTSALTFQGESKLPPGEYTIELTVGNPPSNFPSERILEPTWQGTVVSNPIKIKVVEKQ